MEKEKKEEDNFSSLLSVQELDPSWCLGSDGMQCFLGQIQEMGVNVHWGELDVMEEGTVGLAVGWAFRWEP